MTTLTMERWERLSPSEREACSRELLSQLPPGSTFRQLASYSLGEVQHEIAEFEIEDVPFVLIPGGSVTVGFDLDRPWEPTAEELKSWQSTIKEYELTPDPRDYLAQATLRPRGVELSPLLIEKMAGEVGWERISVEEPEVREIVGEHLADEMLPNQVQIYKGGGCIRVQRGADGAITAEESMTLTPSQYLEKLGARGFRLLTSDEWEYVCSAGAPTLFRWGDHVPCDRYPTDISPAEAAWRREWVLSSGKLKYPAEGFQSDWDLHRQPNAFGLHIASDPYKNELVMEEDITRGGDGGCTICGGAGFFIGWLTLATAYFEEHACRRDPHQTIESGFSIARRVFPLEE